jgi:hypothetical protein
MVTDKGSHIALEMASARVPDPAAREPQTSDHLTKAGGSWSPVFPAFDGVRSRCKLRSDRRDELIETDMDRRTGNHAAAIVLCQMTRRREFMDIRGTRAAAKLVPSI